ncbi:MAG: hypothetical protein R6U41_10260 [Desulfosalsimonas sp.]|uniref:hypothetical protein n=1 Tax=Desulfosalsimonas sp. TaxID=3073848 RepID=UPI0039711745
MKKVFWLMAAVVFCSFGFIHSAIAEERATVEEIYEMCIKAANVLEVLGHDALSEFNNPEGEFVWKYS